MDVSNEGGLLNIKDNTAMIFNKIFFFKNGKYVQQTDLFSPSLIYNGSYYYKINNKFGLGSVTNNSNIPSILGNSGDYIVARADGDYVIMSAKLFEEKFKTKESLKTKFSPTNSKSNK